MLRKHYCENEVETIIAQMDDEIHWLGVGEQEYAVGLQTVAGIFRQFVGQVPKCNISGEEYHVLQLAADVYMCTGRLWVAAGTNAQDYLRVHQRITTIFRWVNDQPKCCHIHISNPYTEMAEDDCGFPGKMAQQSYLYLQEQIEAQKKQITAQTEMLQKMGYEDSLTHQMCIRDRYCNAEISSRDQNYFGTSRDGKWGDIASAGCNTFYFIDYLYNECFY